MNEHCHLLLVEDNPRDVEFTLDALIESGLALEVTVLGDGQEALDYLNRRGKFRLSRPDRPSIILLDVKMPKMNGLEVLQHLKADPHFKTIPVVMLTSSQQESDLMTAYALSADGYLIKPIKPEQLAKTIERAIEAAAKGA